MKKRKHYYRYPFPIMEVGDSFLMTEDKLFKNIYAVVSHTGSKNLLNLRLRKVPQGLRVWLAGYKTGYDKFDFKVEKGIPMPLGKFSPAYLDIQPYLDVLANGKNEVTYAGTKPIGNLRSLLYSQRKNLPFPVRVEKRGKTVLLTKVQAFDIDTLLKAKYFVVMGKRPEIKAQIARLRAAAWHRKYRLKVNIQGTTAFIEFISHEEPHANSAPKEQSVLQPTE